MSEDAALDVDEPSLDLIEEENNEIRKKQIQSINDSIRKVRRISRESQRAFQAAAVLTEVSESLDRDDSPGFYVESPGRIERVGPEIGSPDDVEDDTGRFCIPEPVPTETVSAALSQALDSLEQERRSFVSSTNSPVLKRWKIL